MVDLVNEFYEEGLNAAHSGEKKDDENDDNEDDEDDEEEEDSEEEDDSEEESDEDSTDLDDDEGLLLQEQKKPKQQTVTGSFSFTSPSSFSIKNTSNSNASHVSFNSNSFNKNNNPLEQHKAQQQQFFVGSVGSSLSLMNRGRQANQTPINSRKHARTNNNSGMLAYLILIYILLLFCKIFFLTNQKIITLRKLFFY
jgi:hypothetical protein